MDLDPDPMDLMDLDLDLDPIHLSLTLVIDAVFNGIIIPVTKPYSIAVLVSTSNTNTLRSSFLISLNRFFLKSLSKYCLIDTILKVTIRSLLYL